jgi:uncharacterized protein YjaG (DUF416 family)
MPIVLKSWNLNLLEPSGAVQACNGIALLLYTKIEVGCLEEVVSLAISNNDPAVVQSVVYVTTQTKQSQLSEKRKKK